MDSSPLLRTKDRTVLHSLAELDTSTVLPSLYPSSLQAHSLALSTASPSQTLVYVGTRGGHLLLLSLDPSLQLLRSTPVSHSPLDSIQILPEIGRLLLLAGGSLYLLDLLLLLPPQRLPSLKNATAASRRLRFAESASPDPLGAVAARSAASRPGQGLLQKLGGGIRANGAKAWAPEDRHGTGSSCFAVVAVAGKGLVLMELLLPEDLDVGISVVTREVPGVDGVRTIAWVDDSVIVGTAEGYSLFSIEAGQFVPIFSLPEAAGAPQLKPLCRSKELILLVDNVGIVVDAHGQPVGGSLVFRSLPDSVTEMASYVVASIDGRLELHRKKGGACIQSISLPKGPVDPFIVASDDWGSGDIIVSAASCKIICFCRLSSEVQIKDLLKKRYYKEAVCLVEELESEGEITKEMLSCVHAQVGFMLLFELQFEDAVNHFLLSESMQPSEIFPFIMHDPNRWSPLVPRNRYWGFHPPPVLLEQLVDDGLTTIQRAIFLKKAGVDAFVNEDFVQNPPNRADLLESAIKNIIRYLRVSRDKDLDLSVREGVDTLLMYLYRSLNLVVDMEKLASSPNSCLVEELETLLDDSGHLRTLAFLYASKGMSSKALAIWHVLARNYSSGLWNDPASVPQHGLPSAQRTAAIEASKLLEESSDQGLILQHLGWIADEDQETAVRVLTSDKRDKQLSPGEVLASINPRKVEIRQRYLQWLIEEQDSDDAQLHTMYAISLATSALGSLQILRKDGSFADTDNSEDGELSVVPRDRLQFFLQSSDLYDPEEILRLIGKSGLWLEKAILYRKLGEERQVLEILALELEDSEAAEQYCAEIGKEDTYMQLLDMYLNPRDGKEPFFKAAVCLIHKHGEFLDPLRVIQKLSPDMPLQLASNTILKVLRARVHHHLQGQIVHHLSHALNIEAKLARLEERSRHVQINDESICSSCHTNLGTKLLAMYPDDTVVCYKCYRRQGESKSASGHDFKQDAIFKPGWLVTRNY